LAFLDSLIKDFGSEIMPQADFCSHPTHQSNPADLHGPQMMPKQPLIIIIWVHQEMMAWMSRKSIGIFGQPDEGFWLRHW
jgi:hypothetical protein